MTSTGYKKLLVWQKSDQLVTEIYSLSRAFPREEQFGFTSQIRRAALSVPLNVIEGYAREGDKSFASFLSIAYGSLVEVEYLLEVALRLGYVRNIESTQKLAHEVGQLLWNLRRKVRSDQRVASLE